MIREKLNPLQIYVATKFKTVLKMWSIFSEVAAIIYDQLLSNLLNKGTLVLDIFIYFLTKAFFSHLFCPISDATVIKRCLFIVLVLSDQPSQTSKIQFTRI